jgi:hypothetical protein
MRIDLHSSLRPNSWIRAVEIIVALHTDMAMKDYHTELRITIPSRKK